MAGILKLFYIAIIYVSLFLVVIESKGKLILNFFYLRHNISFIYSNIFLSLFYIADGCKTYFDCLIQYPSHKEDTLKCIGGHCVCINYQLG